VGIPVKNLRDRLERVSGADSSLWIGRNDVGRFQGRGVHSASLEHAHGIQTIPPPRSIDLPSLGPTLHFDFLCVLCGFAREKGF
jgi:hypothetical protein